MTDSVYLDNNSTTPVAPEVVEAMTASLAGNWGNPSSMHSLGVTARKTMDSARRQVADLVHARPPEIVFTSGGTESNNLGLRSGLAASGLCRVITTRVEHPSVLEFCRRIQKDDVRVELIDVDRDGRLKMDAFRAALDTGPALVSMMWANNETGVLFPVEEAARLTHAAGGLIHTDAVQVLGKLPVDVRSAELDFLSGAGHKLHGPKGIGFLYARRGIATDSVMVGGHQESGRRGGTENVPGIVGLGTACELAAATSPDDIARIAGLRDRLETGLIDACPGAVVNGGGSERLPNTTQIAFANVEGDALLLRLSDLGIAVSLGSACSTGQMEISHVLQAMHVSRELAKGSMRFSLSRYTTRHEVERVLEILPPLANGR
jgi:cysteine desulfurase